jgi:hypothetical protein
MQQNKTYFNTTNLSKEDLKESIANAFKQEELIVNLYKRYGSLSPSDVLKLLDFKYPITSVRRAITTLTKKHLLIKTEVQKKGLYGKLEYIWALPEQDVNEK